MENGSSLITRALPTPSSKWILSDNEKKNDEGEGKWVLKVDVDGEEEKRVWK